MRMTAESEPGNRTRVGHLGFVFGWSLLAGALPAAVAAWNLRLWQADLRVPLFGLQGDNSLSYALMKGVLEQSWVWSNPRIGAPFGTEFFDYPSAFGDSLLLAVIKLMGFVSTDPILVVNAFYLLGFPAVGIAAFWVLRSLDLGPSVALVGSLLFAVLPGHFGRGIAHLGLSTYWAVPLGAWLILGAAGVHSLFQRRSDQGLSKSWLAWVSGRSALTVGLVLLVGLSGLYYALFAFILVTLVGVVYFLAKGSRGALIQSLLVAGMLLAVIAVQQLPSVVYVAENGRNGIVATRTAGESELYGLKLTQVLLPSKDHRLDPLASIGRDYVTATGDGEGLNSNLGIILGLALLVTLCWPLCAAVGTRTRDLVERIAIASGISSILAVLLATVGGGGALAAFLLTPQIRAWNRISMYLAFFAVVVLAIMLTRSGQWLTRRGLPTAFAGVGLVAVATIGVLDQTVSPRIDYVGVKESWRSDVRFVREIGDRIPADGKILQLPYVPFPENPPVAAMSDYELFVPYIADREGLKWSYGAMKGRSSDWADDLDQMSAREAVYGATLAGFDGIYVDRDGYRDDAREIVRKLETIVGSDNEIRASDGRAVFFDLEALKRELNRTVAPAEREQIAKTVLEPVSAVPGRGFSALEVIEGIQYAWGDRQAEIKFENPSALPVKSRVRFALAGPSATASTRITVRCPQTGTRTFRVTSVKPRRVSLNLTIPGGSTSCSLSAVGPEGPVTPADPRRKFQRLIAPELLTEGERELVELAGRKP